jgi:Cof subfamily protein (haloacid dehalogenase superfamily)
MALPRMVATDLDGTLVRGDGTVSERTRAALRRASAAGAEVMLVTARPPRYVDRLGLDAGIAALAVCGNGAIVYDAASRTVVEARQLALAVARKVAAVLTGALPGIGFAVETGREVLCEPAFTRRFSAEAGAEVTVPDLTALWRAAPIVKLLAWCADRDVDAMLAVACAAVGGAAEVTHSGGTGLLEVSAPGVTKAGTLAGLCAARGIDPAQVIAFGDMPNDLTILGWAGTAYAMANAHPAVLAAVRRHTASNDQDGVAEVLEWLYRGV